MRVRGSILKSHTFSIILLAAIFLGGLLGYLAPQLAVRLKPLGDIFLNLIFTAIIPLIFFSVSSAIAKASSAGKLGKIILYMLCIFIFTGIVAATLALIVVTFFPPAQGVLLPLTTPATINMSIRFSDQLVRIFTVPNFAQLLSHENMLPLIIFSLFVGLAVASTQEKNKAFANFLAAGEDVFMRVFSYIMCYAPIGFFAYFAFLVSELGPKLITSYIRIAIIYYSFAILYFIFVFTCYAYLAARWEGVKLFWKNVFLPMLTAIATCSSAASIPANLIATKEMRVPTEIYETVIPLGALLHKDGSVIGGMIKIAFLFGIFHLSLSGWPVLLTALAISILVGTVMGAIPSGGLLGELLILNVYGFPSSALIAIAAISIIIDPAATMLNVTGDSVASMMIARLTHGKNWFHHKNT